MAAQNGEKEQEKCETLTPPWRLGYHLSNLIFPIYYWYLNGGEYWTVKIIIILCCCCCGSLCSKIGCALPEMLLCCFSRNDRVMVRPFKKVCCNWHCQWSDLLYCNWNCQRSDLFYCNWHWIRKKVKHWKEVLYTLQAKYAREIIIMWTCNESYTCTCMSGGSSGYVQSHYATSCCLVLFCTPLVYKSLLVSLPLISWFYAEALVSYHHAIFFIFISSSI